MMTIRPVILVEATDFALSGVSVDQEPACFYPLLDGDSLFQDTLERVGEPEFLPPLVIAAQTMQQIIEDQCEEIVFDLEELILCDEDIGSAAMVALASEWAKARGEDFPLLICRADQFVGDQTAFMRALEDSVQTANEGYLVSFGVIADFAQSGHDYVEVGTRLHVGYSGHNVTGFAHDADPKTAEDLLGRGRNVWHSRIICATPQTLVQELEKQGVGIDDQRSFEGAVMAQSEHLAVVSLLTPCADLKSWSGLWKILSLI